MVTTASLIERLQARAKDEGMKQPEQVRRGLEQEMTAILTVEGAGGQPWDKDAGTLGAKRAVILVVGVNGSGKTTSIAKLAWSLKSDGKRVVLAAADTFRAAAIDQLCQWGERVQTEVVAHQQGADPGAVVFDALTAAERRGADAVIIDTA
ncbi:unnamed protein product, partial [marine sediment metagenome]